MKFIPLNDRTVDDNGGPMHGVRTVIGYLEDEPIMPWEDMAEAVCKHFTSKGWDGCDVRMGHESYRTYVRLISV
jgi:hypothetical protein